MLLKFEKAYNDTILKQLKKTFSYKNEHQVPKIAKVVINMSVGEVVNDSKAINSAIGDLTAISGQIPYVTYAKKSIAGFKLREGMKLGCKVTLRRSRMYEFLERLVVAALPRVKDFRGFSIKSFDGKGNITFGIKDHIVFPEIDYDKVDKSRGMDITIVTTAETDEQAKFLLSNFNIPFYN